MKVDALTVDLGLLGATLEVIEAVNGIHLGLTLEFVEPVEAI